MRMSFTCWVYGPPPRRSRLAHSIMPSRARARNVSETPELPPADMLWKLEVRKVINKGERQDDTTHAEYTENTL